MLNGRCILSSSLVPCDSDRCGKERLEPRHNETEGFQPAFRFNWERAAWKEAVAMAANWQKVGYSSGFNPTFELIPGIVEETLSELGFVPEPVCENYLEGPWELISWATYEVNW